MCNVYTISIKGFASNLILIIDLCIYPSILSTQNQLNEDEEEKNGNTRDLFCSYIQLELCVRKYVRHFK